MRFVGLERTASTQKALVANLPRASQGKGVRTLRLVWKEDILATVKHPVDESKEDEERIRHMRDSLVGNC